MGKKLKDEEVLGPKALNRIADFIGIMTPFVSAHPNPSPFPHLQHRIDATRPNGDFPFFCLTDNGSRSGTSRVTWGKAPNSAPREGRKLELILLLAHRSFQ
jgi:hypothetical protein